MDDVYLDFYGRVIGFAMQEYSLYKKDIGEMLIEAKKLRQAKNKTSRQSTRSTKLQEIIEAFETAEKFLFDPEWLERTIKEIGLPIDIDFIRKKAGTFPFPVNRNRKEIYD